MPAGEASVSSDGRKPTRKKSRSSSPSSSSSNSSRSVSAPKSKAKKDESSKKKKPERSSESDSGSSDSETTKKTNGKKKQVSKSKKQASSSSESESSNSSSDSEPKKQSSKRKKVSKSPKRRKSPEQTHKAKTKEKSRQRSASTSPAKLKGSPAKKAKPPPPSPSPPPPPSPSPPPPPPIQEVSSKTSKKEVETPKEKPRSQSPSKKKSKGERSPSPVQKSTEERPKKTKSRSRSQKREKAKRSKSRSHSRSKETRRKRSKSPVAKRRSRSSSSSSESGHARRRNGGGGGIRIGRKTGVPVRQPKGVRASDSPSPRSASGSLKSIAEKETTKENSVGSKKVVVDKSDTSLFKEDSVGSGVKAIKKENGATSKSRFGPPLPETKIDTPAEPVRERKPTVRPPPKPLARANPDSPLTLPRWCDLIDWHDKRDVHFEMLRRSEKLGNVSLQQRKCYVIGRTAPLCDIVIDHPSLSRRHAVILHHRENGCVYVMDLKSTQGTWVNRRKLIPHLPTALTEKCTLSFGTSSREYHLRGLVPQGVELSQDTLTILTSRGTLENTVIEGIQMGEDGPLPFHAVTTDDKQLVHDEPLPEESVRLPKTKPVITTVVSTQTGRFEDMEPETAFVPVAEPTGSAEEEKLKSLTPAARIVFLRKQEEAKAAAARQQALRAMSSGTVLRGPVVVPLTTDKTAESADSIKKEVGLYDVIDQVGKRSTLDAKQKKILLGGTKIPSITSSFCSSSSSKLDND